MSVNLKEVETKRLILRELNKQDITGLYQIYSDEKTMEYTDTEVITDINKIEEEIDFVKELVKDGKGVRFGVFKKSNDTLIGTVGYHKWNKIIRKAEIGFEIGSPYWRQGYMGEVMYPIISYGFSTMNLNRIEALTLEDNFKSTNLLEKHGFKREGLLRENTVSRGIFKDEYIYSLLEKDWLI